MKNLALTILFLLLYEMSFGQFHYTFTSYPDSVPVIVNGKTECYTPCRVKYFWRDAVSGKMAFALRKNGYEIWSDTLNEKPWKFDLKQDAQLKRVFPAFEMDSSAPIVSFDRLLMEIKDGTKVGKTIGLDGKTEPIKWGRSIKFGSESFGEKFYEILIKAGFQTPFSQNAKLFSDDSRERKRLPRFTVGAKLVDYGILIRKIKPEFYGTGNTIGTTSMELEWQVLDNASGKVALKKSTKGEFRYRGIFELRAENLSAFEDALIKFLNDSAFIKLVHHAKPITLKSQESKVGDKKYEIEPLVLPEFKSMSEMIKRASSSCVTVITDGGHGSGVIINEEGYVLTAYHVIEGVNQIQIQFSNGLKLNAKVLSFDKSKDVVLLDIDGSGFKSLPLAIKKEAPLGEDVITIGTPAEVELGQSIAKGILSGKRKIDDHVYLQVDMAVSPGNSGGPLINLKGEVIGIVERKIIGNGIEGIGFAIPIDQVAESLNIVNKKDSQ